jgi:GNAT superfamily N-acetyltransferase
MPDLRVEPLKDDDVEESMRTQYVAFRHAEGIGRLLSPEPLPTKEYIAASSSSRRKTMHSNPAARFRAVFDNSTGQLIACAHWDIYTEERTQDQVDESSRLPPVPPGVHPDAWNDFFGNISKNRITVLGTRPIAMLCTLVTHPDHYRRGAGTLLMEQFVNEADREGLEAYLEASEVGKSLYARFGFSPVSEREFHLEKYGATGVDRNTVMIREARAK